jgi:hypothetical protein
MSRALAVHLCTSIAACLRRHPRVAPSVSSSLERDARVSLRDPEMRRSSLSFSSDSDADDGCKQVASDEGGERPRAQGGGSRPRAQGAGRERREQAAGAGRWETA